MAKYIVRENEHILHNGKEYFGEDSIELTEEQASLLKVDSQDGVQQLKATEVIALIEACETSDAVDALIKDEKRKTVLDAAEAKKQELKEKKENDKNT